MAAEAAPGAGPRADAPGGVADDLDLGGLLRALWRGRWWLALAAAVGMALGAWYALRVAVPVYTATAVLVIDDEEQRVVDLEGVVSGFGGDQTSINTEIAIMRSRGLLGKLADELSLIDEPLYNPRLRPFEPTLRDRALAALPEAVQALPGLAPRRAPAALDPEARRQRIVDALRGQIAVSNQRQSLVFRITATTTDPSMSARVANGLAELYVRDQVEAELEQTARATDWLTERVAELQGDLEAAQDRLRDFAATTQIVDVEEVEGLNRQIADLRARLARAERSVSAGASPVARALAAEDWAALLEATGDPTLRRLLAQPEGPARAAALRARGQALAGDEPDAGRAGEQAAALARTLGDLEAQFTERSDALVTLEALEREVAQTRALTEYFQTRLREIAVQQGIQSTQARVLSPAQVPRFPAAPSKRLIVAGATLAALLAAGAVLIARELMQSGIRSAEELETLTGLTVMGQLPRVKVRSRMAMLDYLSERSTSRLAEAFRDLRTSIMLSNLDRAPRVILSTSSVPGEGKTTQSLALAQGYGALDGKRVLLIECDIRRRTFSDKLDFTSEFGLLAVLSGEAELADVVQRRPEHLPNVDVLVGDRGKANPVDVFSSARFARFLQEMREAYDVVILDAPPVLAVPDARVIAPESDAVLYAVKWDDTPRSAVREGLRLLASVNVRVAGLVLTQIDVKGMERYGQAGYGRYGEGYYAD